MEVGGASLPDVSVVIPFFNEEENIVGLLEEVRNALESLGSAWEVVAVDDGSSDATPLLLAAEGRSDPRVRVLRWEKNRGQGAALFCGLHAALAPLIATLDGDGQNDPADIPILLAKLGDLDMLVGIRADRRDNGLRRLMSRAANGVRSRTLGDGMRDSGCAIRVFRREVVDAMIPIQTLYSFVPALAIAAGFRVGQQEVRHRPRTGGVSSYGLGKMLWRPLLDLLGVLWFIRRRSSTTGE
jgi:dolichol-phosphate mannosyltransferase